MAEASEAGTGRGSRRSIVLLVVAFVAIVVAVVLFYLSATRIVHQQQWTEALHEAQSTAADIAQAGADITAGGRPDFDLLSSDVEEFEGTLGILHKGDDRSGMPALPGAVKKPLDELDRDWLQMKNSVAGITGAQNAYESSVGATASIAGAVPQFAQIYAQIARRVAARGDAQQAYRATAQLALLGQIADAARAINGARSDPGAQAGRLNDQIAQFLDVNRTLGGSDAAVAPQTRQVAEDFAPYAAAAAQLLKSVDRLDKIQAAAKQVNGYGANILLPALHDLSSAVRALGHNDGVYQIVAYVAAVLALLALIAFAVLFSAAQVARRRLAEERDRRQQQAILKLLDEITNLADGDLTGDITVTEDFTGAIADSINYTVQTLRSLVGTINRTSERIVSAAGDTSGTAQRMSEDSDRQAREITEMTSAIANTSDHLQGVAARAEALARQARESVDAAHGGAETVGRTIQSMTALREQIQDTAKRIKRLGESSQEIGNIVEFIDDIAEQTNTLALNASIQAAMAGEAGRGFAVVAGEVQRLAERAGGATRRIEGLIKTIQADTGEAVVSMERSTSNVVAGSRSAEEAGRSLGRIETASQDLARTIAEISTSARDQSASATQIAQTMQGIRQIAVQTSGSARKTSQATSDLNELADKLRESVAGFKLPEQMPDAI